jgi:hypothetical protein
MGGKIRLSVTRQVETAAKYPAIDRAFPDRGPDQLASPGDVARETDVDRN